MKFEESLLEDIQLPETQKGLEVEKKESPSKKKPRLLYIIGGVVFLLLLISAIVVSYLITMQNTQAGQTPLFSAPELTTDPGLIKAPSKSDQYKAEMQNRKKNEKKEALEADRMDRIAMRWEGIYKPEERSSSSSTFKEEEGLDEKSKKLGEGNSSPREAIGREKPVYKSSSVSKKRNTSKGRGEDQNKQRILSRRIESEHFGEITFNTLELKKSRVDSPPIARADAVIDGDQKIRQGQYIKFRLTENLSLPGGEVILANTPLMGLSEFGNSRIKAEVSQVFYEGEALPIYMKVFDRDLIEGITYNDPRIKQREKDQVDQLGYDLYDDIFSEIPYAGGFLAAGRNMARNRSREKSQKVFLTNNYRVVFQVYNSL